MVQYRGRNKTANIVKVSVTKPVSGLNIMFKVNFLLYDFVKSI